MARATSLLLVAAFTFASIPQQAVSQTAPPTAVPGPVGIANRIDPNALQQIKQVDDANKVIKSFTAEFDESVDINDDVISFAQHSEVAFRSPDQLMLNTDSKSGPTHVISDGNYSATTFMIFI